MQEARLTSADVKKTPFTLIVAFSDASYASASGKLFVDNGVDLEMEIRDGSSTFVQYFAERSLQSGSLVGRVISGDYALQQGLVLQNVRLLGVSKAPSQVTVNGVQIAVAEQLKYDANLESAEISGLKVAVGKDFEMKWEAQEASSWASQ